MVIELMSKKEDTKNATVGWGWETAWKLMLFKRNKTAKNNNNNKTAKVLSIW